MMENLKKVSKIDYIVIVMAIWVFTQIDFNHLTTFEYIYLASIALWFFMFLGRTFFAPQLFDGTIEKESKEMKKDKEEKEV